MTEKKMNYSPGQEAAIHARGKNLLVAAAAGSGKTFTLIERILQGIREGRCRIDELMVATFTNAAAAEMRTRVEKKLTAAAETDPAMAAQLVRLPGASISTLHSFCQTLVRQNFAALDIDPRFRLGNQQEMALLKDRVVTSLFEDEYETGHPDFLQFVWQYGDDRGDKELHDIVLNLYDFARSQADPESWLTRLVEDFVPAPGEALADLPWYAEIRDETRQTLLRARDTLTYLINLAPQVGCDAYLTNLEKEAAQIDDLLPQLDALQHDALCRAVNALSFDGLKKATGADEAGKKFIQDMRKKEVKKAIESLQASFFAATEAEIRQDLEAAAPVMRTVVDLTRRFSEAFRKAKKKKSVLDFDDLEHFALRLLQDDAFARALRGRYREIMVDEYQDTNGVQEAILQRLFNGHNLFTVGDIKQSIYRFRMADPDLFRQKQTAYGAGDPSGQLITLGENYRSRPGVVAAVNFLFSQIMVAPEMEISYGREEALYARGAFPETAAPGFAGAATEVVLLEADASTPADDSEDGESLSGFAAEAAWIAGRLRELHDSQVRVFDKDTESYRPIRWRDMAVLLRAPKGKAQVLLEALQLRGVPAYASVDAGYFQEIEVQRMLALLAVIDNARQDIPLAAVLHSPIGGMTAEELAEMRVAAPDGDFCDAFERSANPKAAAFREKLAGWRRLARRVGVPELIWQLYRDTGYYDFVGAEPGGRLRQANLRMLSDRAADYEKTNLRGLFRFLEFIRRMRDNDTDLSVARTLGENEDVVRVMTIHKSKGLEFPVVVLADIGKGFNMKDTTDDLLIHRELGLGPYRVESEGTISWRYPTLRRQAVAARIQRESRAEEMRLLYVAMTRAREKLILTGQVKGLVQQAAKWCRYAGHRPAALPGYAVAAAKNWLDWLGPALARDEDGGRVIREIAAVEEPPAIDYDRALLGAPRWEIRILPPPTARTTEEEAAADDWLERIRALEPLPVADDGNRIRRLDWRYPWQSDIPAKITVTEWKRRQTETTEGVESGPPAAQLPGLPEDNVFVPPAFLAPPPDVPGGLAYGTLMHAVLQRLNLGGDCTRDSIGAQLDALAAAGVLSEEERRSVNVKSLLTFLASPLGQRLRIARQVWREQPFSLLLPAARLNPQAAPEDEVFLQGVIDVFFEEADGRTVLIDYKTDRHTDPETIRRRYRIQLSLYAEAIGRLTGKTVQEAYIYRLFDGDAIAMDL
ncbi:MAG: helicase-exonuclease AddAB subunit AddA [Schwartzia sp.]|nr:helicase-exonuclease AddAB subunit AddA [Schwartzia sp. (in: firmicutes)]